MPSPTVIGWTTAEGCSHGHVRSAMLVDADEATNSTAGTAGRERQSMLAGSPGSTQCSAGRGCQEYRKTTGETPKGRCRRRADASAVTGRGTICRHTSGAVEHSRRPMLSARKSARPCSSVLLWFICRLSLKPLSKTSYGGNPRGGVLAPLGARVRDGEEHATRDGKPARHGSLRPGSRHLFVERRLDRGCVTNWLHLKRVLYN